MRLKDVPLHELKIGQVVRFNHSGKFAFICEITAEIPCNEVQDYKPRVWYRFPRYPWVTCFHESGRVDQGYFHMCFEHVVVMDRIVTPEEMFKFPEIAQQEGPSWKEKESV